MKRADREAERQREEAQTYRVDGLLRDTIPHAVNKRGRLDERENGRKQRVRGLAAERGWGHPSGRPRRGC